MRRRNNLSSQKVIDETFNLINKYGERYVTFSKVSKNLGVRSQALYTYFNNQHELVIAVAKEYFSRIIKVIRNSVVGIGGTKAIMTYLETMRDYGKQNIRVNSMAFSHASNPKVQKSIKPLAQTLLQLLKPIYKTDEKCHVISRELINQVIGELINEEIGLFPKSIMNHDVSFKLGIKQILKN